MKMTRHNGVLGMLLACAAACGGGATPGSGAESPAAGAGGPPRTQDTAAPAADRNPSAAPTTVTTPPRIVMHEVNTGPHGMIGTVRWLLSPDQRAIIVVEDPVGVEAEPVPDGFLFASEATGVVVQVNGVWDVAPSPDWSRLAFGRAFVFRSGESETIPEREWTRLHEWVPEDVAAPSAEALRRIVEPYAFPVSGMSYARAISLATIVDVGALQPGRSAAVQGPTVRLEGWRVRWTPSGDTLAVGAAPRTVQDDADAMRWTLVRTRGVRSYRDSLGVAPAGVRLVTPAWVNGPMIDVSVDIDMNQARRVPVSGGAVTSSNGRIRVERGGAVIEVGEGAVLAATREGRFIAALVPNRSAREFDPKVRLVVYELAR